MRDIVCTRIGCEQKSVVPQQAAKGLQRCVPAGRSGFEFADFSCILIHVVSTSCLDEVQLRGSGPCCAGKEPLS